MAGIGAAVVVLVTLVALRPLVDQTVQFVEDARAAIRDPNPGHLPGPADRRLVWGSWVGTDFRYPYERYRVTETGHRRSPSCWPASASSGPCCAGGWRCSACSARRSAATS